MKSDRYEPRICEICGATYKPGKINQKTCGCKECVEEQRRRHSRQWQREHYAKKREYIRKMREATPKPDTIIAIGYAERQMAASLARAGKVKTEL